MNLIAADVGGTNTRLVLAGADSDEISILFEKSYRSAEFSDLIEVVKTFFADHGEAVTIDAACIAVAGPVKSGIASVTNLPWEISVKELSTVLKTKTVELINDFSAVAYGVPELKENVLATLQEGKSTGEISHPDFAVIGAGTGLGASHVVWAGDHYRPYPSEAGHAGFAPQNTLQCQLSEWLLKTNAHISLEMVLSGNGIVTIYKFLRDVIAIPETAKMAEKLDSKNLDHAGVITDEALASGDELCHKTMQCFCEIYGSAAANFVLQHYPLYEVYIAGGIAPKIKPYMMQRGFIRSFLNKGKMSGNMKEVSIKLVLEEKVGLYGALSRARYLSS